MPGASAATKQRKQAAHDAHDVIAYEFLPDIPLDVTPQQVGAIIDMAMGYTETAAGEHHGLSRDQCARLKAKYRGEIETMKAAKGEIVAALTKTACYTLIQLGLDAAQHMPRSAVNTPSKLQAVVNAARTLQTMAEEQHATTKPARERATRDTRAALADLAAIQDVVVSPPAGTSGKPNTT